MYCKGEEANFAKGRKRDSERSRGKPRRRKVRETKGKYGFKKQQAYISDKAFSP